MIKIEAIGSAIRSAAVFRRCGSRLSGAADLSQSIPFRALQTSEAATGERVHNSACCRVHNWASHRIARLSIRMVKNRSNRHKMLIKNPCNIAFIVDLTAICLKVARMVMLIWYLKTRDYLFPGSCTFFYRGMLVTYRHKYYLKIVPSSINIRHKRNFLNVTVI